MLHRDDSDFDAELTPARGTLTPMTDLATSLLYDGDDLYILRRYLPDAAVG